MLEQQVLNMKPWINKVQSEVMHPLDQFSTIPDRFTQIAPICCAFSFANTEYPDCMGEKSYCQCYYFEFEHYCFKCVPPSQDSKVCCITNQTTLELAEAPANIPPRGYLQLFCLELLCGYPLNKAFTGIQPSIVQGDDDKKVVAPKDVIFCCTCSYCFFVGGAICGCYKKFPECFGSFTTSQCCCLKARVTCFKPTCYSLQHRQRYSNNNHNRNNSYCLLLQSVNYIVNNNPCNNNLCYQSHAQYFCYDSYCSCCPYRPEVLCIYGLLPCCTLCVGFRSFVRCAPTMQDIEDFANTTTPPGSAVIEQQRTQLEATRGGRGGVVSSADEQPPVAAAAAVWRRQEDDDVIVVAEDIEIVTITDNKHNGSF